MSKHIVLLTVSFILLMLVQILVFRNFVLFQVGFAFVYLLFLLSLPMEVGFTAGMILGLISALILDLFYQSLGIHASAAVFIMFVRPTWLKAVLPRGGYEPNDMTTIGTYGLQWFLGYATPLVLVYCLIVFFVEAGTAQLFWHTVTKALVSTVITLVFVVFAQYLFYPKTN
ncbi:Rod shape-determining protein MreD [Roseivirga thermotolerans]|uniref:Rod shape-determining protein MreD n=1 Tax=Roseivirga thermotolerans TaxID=1758176 RepID=UPI00273CFE3D|nr:Rod shape-determining protein MreD [Roseivirga thermotolerans]